MDLSKPNQPLPDAYPIQQAGKKGKVFTFQSSWYMQFPWLHGEAGVSGVLCFYCMKSNLACGAHAVAKNTETAFVSSGFLNWKKAVEKFRTHEASHAHAAAVVYHLNAKAPITAQLSSYHRQQQVKARKNLLSICECIRYLARQGIALRGHEQGEGNLDQLLKLSARTNDDLKFWLHRNQDYTSPTVQNEILSLLANSITRAVCHDITTQDPVMFSLIVDGTKDITGIEQESICVRYVRQDLVPAEVFMGFYEATITTGQNIATIAKDVLIRLQLPIAFLRGQTYDGAANMAGVYNGAQAVIRREQPLAYYVHCVGHCVNLATEAALNESTVVRDAVSLVNELEALSSQSGKFKILFEGAASSLYDKAVRLRPLCPTRWTVRAKAMRHVLQQYESILQALEDMSATKGDSATRAGGLLSKYKQGSTLLALVMASDIMEVLETLNASLQSRQKTMSGMKAAIEHVLTSLDAKRNDAEYFNMLYKESVKQQAEFDLEVINSPRQRRQPRRYTGPAAAFHPTGAQQYFQLEYYKLIDTASSKLQDVVKQEGAKAYETLESCLLSGCVNETCHQYPELDIDVLRLQLAMFRRQFQYSTLDEAATAIRSMVPEVRQLFQQVEVLVRLLLVIPITSCEAERSFSSLRRLKTWLRNTMTQERLNSVATCNVHHEYIDAIDLKILVNTFVSSTERRQKLFGHF